MPMQPTYWTNSIRKHFYYTTFPVIKQSFAEKTPFSNFNNSDFL